MAIANAPTYQRRFVREPRQGMQVTPRDLEILRFLGEHRFLTSAHLSALLNSSEQATRRRLNRLFHHKYVDRPLEQRAIIARERSGSTPLAYGLTYRGATTLETELNLSFPYERPTGNFLEHTLFISDLVVSFQLSCLEHGARFISFREILEDAPDPNPTGRIEVDVRMAGKLYKDQRAIPDAVFGILPEGETTPAYFFLEADRGTMTIEPKKPNLYRPSLLKKFLVYSHTWTSWKRPTSKPPYGFKNARVLTVVSTKRDPEIRVDNLVALSGTMKTPPGLFLFADAPSLESSDPLTFEWKDAKGRPTRLVK